MESEKAEIAELVAKYGRVQSLMRYVNKETLAKSYSRQPKGKAVGVDGVTKEAYGENLNENLDDLLKSMKLLLQTLPDPQSLYSERKRQDAGAGNSFL